TTFTIRRASQAKPATVPISVRNSSRSESAKSRPDKLSPTRAPRKAIAVNAGTSTIFMCVRMRGRVRNMIRTVNAISAVRTSALSTPMEIFKMTPNIGPRASTFCSAESWTSSGTAFSTSGMEGDSVGSPGASSVPNRNIGSILSVATELKLRTATRTVMLNITDLRNTTYDPATVMPRAKLEVSDASQIVQPIIDQVRRDGVSAVQDLTERFDGVRPANLRVPA